MSQVGIYDMQEWSHLFCHHQVETKQQKKSKLQLFCQSVRMHCRGFAFEEHWIDLKAFIIQYSLYKTLTLIILFILHKGAVA